MECEMWNLDGIWDFIFFVGLPHSEMSTHCSICQQPGGINVDALPAHQAQIMRDRSGLSDVPRVCGSCVQNLCAAGPPPGPSAPNWRDKESAFWHTHHDHDGKPPVDVDRYFKSKGEKSKGDGGFRFSCQGSVPNKEDRSKAGPRPVWRRLTHNPVSQLCGTHKPVTTNVMVCH